MREWQIFLKQQEETLGKKTFETWLKPLKVVDFDARNVYLETQDAFVVAWFDEQMRPKIQEFCAKSGHKMKVHLKCHALEKNRKKTQVYCPPLNLVQDTLDPTATLESFFLTNDNQATVKMSLEIAFSPLFIYGKNGAGKTHLLMAIAEKLKQEGKSFFYVRAETFTEHVVAAIRNGAMQEFRKAYRHVDVLIIDDVHTLARKHATQEEFFHTFNTLHAQGKKILLSADVPPPSLQEIESRLISRFEWGLVLKLERLNPDECRKWLRSRAQHLELALEENVYDFLVHIFHAHPTTLTRALQALVLRFRLPGTLSLGKVQELLSDLLHEERKKELTPEKIVRAVSQYYSLSPDDLMGKSQTKEIAAPRQMAMYLLRMKLKLPYVKIGEIFSRDHSTVMTSVKLVQHKIRTKDTETLQVQENVTATLL